MGEATMSGLTTPGRAISRPTCRHDTRIDRRIGENLLDRPVALRGRKRVAQSAAVLLEMTELAQHNEVATRGDMALHCFGHIERAGACEMATFRARSEVLENLGALALPGASWKETTDE
jgi:hypothetical protein